MNQPADDPRIAAASRHVAGVAALRKIRRIVDEELTQEETKSRWAKRISVFAIIGLIVGASWALHATLK